MDERSGTAAFNRLLNNAFKFRLYLFLKIPSAFFSGIRIRAMDDAHCVVTVPYKWFSKNPFRSTYFACLGMAAEMSTGALAMSHVYQRKPPISMLVVTMEARYFKKATGRTSFTCQDGPAIKATIENAIATGEGQVVKARSVGRNTAGEEIAEFLITWSFKAKAV
jgi:Domain of unknown function (DUF4442)